MDLPARTTAPRLNISNILLFCNSHSVLAPLIPSLRLSSINPKPENNVKTQIVESGTCSRSADIQKVITYIA